MRMKLAEFSVRGAGGGHFARALVILVACVLAFALRAAEGPIESNQSGQELAAKLRSLRPNENTEVRGAFNIQRQDQDTERIPLVMKVHWARLPGRPFTRLPALPLASSRTINHSAFSGQAKRLFLRPRSRAQQSSPVPRQMLGHAFRRVGFHIHGSGDGLSALAECSGCQN